MSSDAPSGNVRSIALVSGKGGSGKTMVAAIMARILDENGHNTILMDADTGTAGMTYYLGLKLVSNIRAGLTDVALRGTDQLYDASFVGRALQKISGMKAVLFFGIGDHRRLQREISEDRLPAVLKETVQFLRDFQMWLIVDCRGGIDRESIAVCEAVDDVILIVETDTTSFQATKHVVDTLSDFDLAHKIRGFMINKVFDDPSVIARSGTSVFGAQFLAAVPFDLGATRSFLVGEVPDLDSLLGIHIWHGLNKAYFDSIKAPRRRPWDFDEFREVGITNLDSVRGGAAIAAIILMLSIIYAIGFSLAPNSVSRVELTIIVFYLVFVGLIGSLEGSRRIVGSFVNRYIRLFKKRPTH